MDPRYSQYYRELRNEIARSFDSAELKELAFDLDPDFELRGSGRLGKTRALLGYARRSGQLPVLEALIRQKRPYVDWPEPFTLHGPQPGPSNARFWLLFALVSLGGIAFLIIRNLPENLPPSIPPSSTATLLAVVKGDPTAVITTPPSSSPSPVSTPTNTPQATDDPGGFPAALIGTWQCSECPSVIPTVFSDVLVNEYMFYRNADGTIAADWCISQTMGSSTVTAPICKPVQYSFIGANKIRFEGTIGEEIVTLTYDVSIMDCDLQFHERDKDGNERTWIYSNVDDCEYQ